MQRRNYQEDDKERKVKNGRIEKKCINKNLIKHSGSTINIIRDQKVKYIQIKRLDYFFRENERVKNRENMRENRKKEEYARKENEIEKSRKKEVRQVVIYLSLIHI